MSKIFIGIDVSKGFADFTILDGNGKQLMNTFKILDNNDGYLKLLDIITKLKSKDNPSIYAAMEVTGNYETHWFNLLSSNYNIVDMVYVINGYRIKHYQKALNSRNKTDAISSYVIARYICDNHNDLSNSETHLYHNCKKLYYMIHNLEKEKTEYINRLRSYLYESFPEFLSIMPDKFSDWCLLLLKKYPTKAILKRAKLKSILKIPYIKENVIKDLYNSCNKSILKSNKIDDQYNAIVISDVVTNILRINELTKKYYEMLSNILPKESIDNLCTIPGVGQKSAIGMIVLIGDINRFETAKKLVAYFGVHPVSNNSGNVEMSRMSKQGNPYARAVLYQITFQMWKKTSFFNNYINNDNDKMNNKKKKTMGKYMQTICRVMWALLKYKTEFNKEKYTLDHSKKQQQIEDKNLMIDNFIDLDFAEINAPISGKMKKKIQEEIIKREPQDNKLSSTGSSRPFP